MFLLQWVLVLVGLLAASWASHSRPRKLRDRRRQHRAALEQWARLARRHGLSVEPSGSPPWTALAGRWAGRPLVVTVLAGGGWGAEREHATQIALTLRCPIDPGLALWRVGQPVPRHTPRAARLEGLPLMGAGDLRPIGADLLRRVVLATEGNATLVLRQGTLQVRCWGLPVALEDHIAGLSRLAAKIEQAVCAPWIEAAAGLGLEWRIEQDSVLLLTAPDLCVRVSPGGVSLQWVGALPGVRRIAPRAEGRAATPIGNPIADRFLLVDADPAVVARLRGGEATALAMEVLCAAPAAAVGAEGIALTLPAGDAAVLGPWVAQARALAAALTRA